MGEVDTKPIESVQAALSLFGEKNDQRKYRSLGSEGPEKEDWELMLTDLANYKVQVEVKEYAYKQAVHKLESYHITIDELYGQLKNCEAEKAQSIQDCREARTWIDKLEFRVNEISAMLMDARNDQEQLVHVVNDLNDTREELHNVKAKLASSEKSKVSAMRQVEEMTNQTEELENQLLSKTLVIDYMQLELKQAKDVVEREKLELRQLQSDLNHEIDTLTCEIQKGKKEIEEMSRRELEGQVEIALLQSEIHKGRSKVAAAEAGEARAKSFKAGLYVAVKQLAIEADEAKKEIKMLRLDEEESGSFSFAKTISMEEYQSLKKDLEAAAMEMEELRSVAKEAVSRANQAERAKAAVEDQLRKWREQKQQRRDAAIAALRKDLVPKERNHPPPKRTTTTKRNPAAMYDRMPTPYPPGSRSYGNEEALPFVGTAMPTLYQPLGKVLDMEF